MKKETDYFKWLLGFKNEIYVCLVKNHFFSSKLTFFTLSNNKVDEKKDGVDLKTNL